MIFDAISIHRVCIVVTVANQRDNEVCVELVVADDPAEPAVQVTDRTFVSMGADGPGVPFGNDGVNTFSTPGDEVDPDVDDSDVINGSVCGTVVTGTVTAGSGDGGIVSWLQHQC